MIGRLWRAILALLRGRAPVRYSESYARKQIRLLIDRRSKQARAYRGWSKAHKTDEMARFPSVGRWAKARGLVRK